MQKKKKKKKRKQSVAGLTCKCVRLKGAMLPHDSIDFYVQTKKKEVMLLEEKEKKDKQYQ